MADRLTLVRALEESGMTSGAADKVAAEIYDAIHENVATKTDLHDLDQRLAVRFEQLERQIDRVVVRLGALVVIVSGVVFAALHYWPPH